MPAIDTGTRRATAGSIGYRTGSSGASGRSIILIAAAFYYEKAADHRSAFVRWRPQVLQFWAGVNIYDKMIFPNPPIMPITLYPLMVLPTVTGAMCWFAIKVGLTTAALIMLFPDRQAAGPAVSADVSVAGVAAQLASDPGGSPSRQQQSVDSVPGRRDVLRLAARVRRHRGAAAGAGDLYKVTPALFFVYFAYKRSWRTVGWGMLGLGIFLLIVPAR